jgi:RNA polymerase sigma-70 factor (ECF subfamily)
MDVSPEETRMLIDRTRNGDSSAFEELFNRHRGRLQKAIAIRMDRRVTARIGASDVLQETYMEAFRRLPQYLKQEKMPFYIWLYWIAREKLIGLHRRHLGARKRTVKYEAPPMPADSSAQLVSGLIGGCLHQARSLPRKNWPNSCAQHWNNWTPTNGI